MRFRLASCVVAWMLILALSLGSVAQSVMAAEMSPTVAAGAVTVPIEDCEDCGGDGAMAEVACYGVCSSSAVLPTPLPVDLGLLPHSDAFIADSQASWRGSTDPFPPRSHVLS